MIVLRFSDRCGSARSSGTTPSVKFRDKIIAFGFTFSLGVAVGLAAYHLHVLDQAAVEAKMRWVVCGFHQSALLRPGRRLSPKNSVVGQQTCRN